MPRYREKPKTIEAQQWFKHGDHPEVMLLSYTKNDSQGWIITPLGAYIGVNPVGPYIIVNSGDFIIKNEDGTYCTMAPDKFGKTYELMGLSD